jgi:hypothetical protein
MGPKMVKLTYGGNLTAGSFDSAEDSGNLADESELADEVETR